jgi:SAM-dependent methyltransferase
METVKSSNPFEIEGEAKRYHSFRPRYHHIPFGLVRAQVGRDFDQALDVACGTGHSTFALSQIAKKTVGCDLSESMLAEARRNYKNEFVKADAGCLPFQDAAFDLVNISMGFHWVDQDKFLAEARRVLREGGFLTIDKFGFSGQISSDPEMQKLHHDFFASHLPHASQKPEYPSEDLIGRAHLKLVKEMDYDHRVSLDADEFINFAMTWSNFQILSEPLKISTAKEMREIYEKIFEQRKLDLRFVGKIFLFRFNL